MADSIDEVQKWNELHLRVSLMNNQARRETPPLDFSPPWCYECGEVMERVRVHHGFFRCVGCQVMHEKEQKQRNSHRR